MAKKPDFLTPGETGALAGSVGQQTTRRKKTGEPFVKAPLTLEDGSSVVCVWWDAVRAPKAGSRVTVVGTVREYLGNLEIHVQRTERLGKEEEPSREQRLIRYYVDCIEAEGLQELELRRDQAAESYLLFTSGPELVLTTDGAKSGPLPPDPVVRDWCTKRLMAGRAQQLFVGYPLVSGTTFRDGREVPILAPLFYLECQVERSGNDFVLSAESNIIEFNPFVLDLLGVPRQERSGYVGALETLEELAEATSEWEQTKMRLAFLGSTGVIDGIDELDPENLSPPPERGLANAAVLFAGERVVMTKSLLEDLDELMDRPTSELRSGPLGALLGALDLPSASVVEPAPAILPTNLSQDRAVASAMARDLTVVTGPPGTGKSQILVNTVAAAISQRESALFASKNNQAVDVVFERLAMVSTEAIPLRAGRTSYRGEVARRIAQGLARPRVPANPLAATRASWETVRTRLEPLYGVEAQREALLERLAVEEKRFEEKRLQGRGIPVLPELSPEAGNRLEEATAARHEAERPAGFWPWSKRGARRRKAHFIEAWSRLRAAVPPALAALLTVQPEPAQARTELRTVEAALGLADQFRKLQRTREEVGSLPDQWELHEKLLALEEERLHAARDLFEALWRDLVPNAGAEDRKAAGIYRDGLQRLAQGQGGSAAALRSVVPKVLPVFPVWGVTNLSARVNFPLVPGLFDQVIIDEASQCDIASALPLLYRAKRALIIGDPNQLIHISSLRRERDRALAERHGLDDEAFSTFGYRDRSLFALAATRVGEEPVFLGHHFRSHPAIITFSNDEVYGSRLTILTPAGDVAEGPVVEWIHVHGEYRRGSRGRSVLNPPEVEKTVQTFLELWELARDSRLSVGIVAPYRAQVEAIRQGIAHTAPSAQDAVVVDTAHRFQGDERDIIIFSPTISAEMPEYHRTFASDRNLVNVAVTRARRRLIVVGDADACGSTPGLVGALCQYISDLRSRGFNSPLERRLWEVLVAAGIEAKPGLEVNGYRLDLAAEADGKRLDIECDGAAFHEDQRKDAIRDEQLKEAGWTVVRFSGLEIHRNLERCVERVIEILS